MLFLRNLVLPSRASSRAALTRARRVAIVVLAVAALVVGLGASANALGGLGAEIVVIDGIHVGNPVMTTYSDCEGFVDQGVPVVPVTVEATFIKPPDDPDPTGPYATAEWTGGYGSMDDHFGTAQGSSPTQFFHILMRADSSSYYGQGEYTVHVHVQDVGTSPAWSEEDKTITLPAPPPSGGEADVKCSFPKPFNLGEKLSGLAKSGLKKLAAQECAACVKAYDALGKIRKFSDLLNHFMDDTAVDDPPDNNYQQIAQPEPAPLLSPPAGLSTTQLTAFTNLEQALADDIGLTRALYTTQNRVWGADNAASQYWYLKQLAAEAKYANRLADALDALPPLFDDLQAAFTPGLPAFSISIGDVLGYLSDIGSGFDAATASDLTKLGASPQDQQQMVDEALTIDPNQLTFPVDGINALFGQDESDWATPMRAMANWATNAANAQPPVVASVSPSSISSSGFQRVTIDGVNLRNVTGINFGPSSPSGGEAQSFSCDSTECTAVAPPGHGTVDVVAVGPGGPSRITPGDRLTYVAPTTPQVTRIFPTSGSVNGGTSVSVWGTGLSDGAVYFGPMLADGWNCTDTVCTATAPQTGGPGQVDVTVVNGAGTSPTVPADSFSYVSGTPPPPAAPVVTSVSPAHGSNLGGGQIEITGSNFTGATEVQFGDVSYVYNPQVVDDSHIVVTAPTSYNTTAKTVDVVVTGPGGASAVNSGDKYTIDAPTAPTITAIAPNSGPNTGGTPVKITGTNLSAGTYFEFGNAGAYPTTCTSTQCTVTTPARAQYDSDGPVPVVASNADGQSSGSTTFTYTAGVRPVVTAVSPEAGVVGGGTDVAILGSHLANGTVDFGSQDVDATCTDTACVATSPPSPTGKPATVHVTVTTNGGTSATTSGDQFGYVRLGTPQVLSVDPTSGWRGGHDEVRVHGSNFTDGTVYFGSKQAAATGGSASCTQTECDVTTPPATATGPVHVTVHTSSGTSQTSSADEFTYLQPTITKISPRRGRTDGTTPVTITGTNLSGGVVYFGSSEANDGSCTDTTCTATAPWSNTTGTVAVRVQQGYYTQSPKTTADRFTYITRPAPTVTGVSPNSGTDAGRDQVTITGTDLDGGAVRFGSSYVPYGTCTPTSCTVTTPPANQDGSVDVTVTAGGMTSAITSADQYTYRKAQAPTISGISPAHGSTEGGTSVTINGADFTYGNVQFDGMNATGVTCSATVCTATTPRHAAAGAVDVTVSTPAGSGTDPQAFNYQTPPRPAISTISPAVGPASGGSWLTITGSNLTGATVTVDGVAANGVTCTPTTCTIAKTPAHATGHVPVTITTDGGTASTGFTYARESLAEHSDPGGANLATEGNIVAGIGGDMWFTVSKGEKIGKVAPDGTVTTYPAADAPTGSGPISRPFGITKGPDGLMWYAERNLDKIVAVNANGVTQHDYQVPGVPGDLCFLTFGPDGRIWFTLLGSGAIGAMNPSDGQVTFYHLPNGAVGPYNLVVGPDGRIWFTEVYGGIGAITTSGKVTEYPLPDANAQPWGISLGPDNRIWFAEQATPRIGAITTSGQVTMYQLPAEPGRNPEGLTDGPDGRVWFAAPNLDQVSALDPSTGAVTDYALPGGNGSEQPRYLGLAPNGTLWVTEFGGPNVASVSGITAAVPPTVTSLGPGYGRAGDQTTITGTNLGAATAVKFGSAAASSYTVVDPAHITATVPSGSGTVDVTVTTQHGTSATSSADKFVYGAAPAQQPVVSAISPTTGPVSGGTRVTITGTDLAGGTVAFAGSAATNVSCTATTCTATSPAGAAGTADVTVTTSGGTSDTTPADQFTYLTPSPPVPTVTGVSPAAGPPGGGNTVTITGTHLSGATVSFGLEAAPPGSCTATSCTVKAPAGSGPVDVRVETAGGTSARSAADRYTYRPDASALSIGKSTTVAYGKSLVIATKLTDTATGSGLSGMTATLWRRASSTGTWTKASDQTTGSDGSASVSVTPTGYTQYQWRFAATADHSGATSATQAVTVSQPVSIKATKTTVKHGSTVKIYGTVKPAGAGQQVSLQRLVRSTWKTVATATLKKQRLPNGKTVVGYVFAVTPKAAGTLKYRVTKAATATLAKGVSATVTLTVT